MRVLGFGTYDVDKHPRVGILLDGLRAHGDNVAELNRPLGFSTAQRVAMLGKPWQAYRFVLRLLACWASLARRSVRIGRARQEGGANHVDAVVVGYLGHFDVVLARLLFPRTRIVLDLLIFAADTALDRGVKVGPKLRSLAWLDAIAIRCADVVVLDTDEHLALVPPAARHKGVVVPVGASQPWFDAGAAKPSSGGQLRVIFFGLYSPLQGAETIGAALRLLGGSGEAAEITVTMVGNGQDYRVTRTAAANNDAVRWLEWVEPDELAALVAAHDVCLGIFGSTAKALRVVPNKVYQGAAAGCAVVTSDTAPQRRMLADAALFVPPADAVALAAALVALAHDRSRAATLGVAARARAQRHFAPATVVVPLRARLTGAQ